MEQQGTSTFDRHPAYDGDSKDVVGAGTPPPAESRPGPIRASTLLAVIGSVVAVATVVAGYALMRWVDEPAGAFVVVVSLALLLLAFLTVVASKVGNVTAFVVIALLLPWSGALAAAAGVGDRVEDGLSDLFGDSTDSSGEESDDFTWDFGDADDESGGDAAAEETSAPIALGDAAPSGSFDVTVESVECTATLTGAAENPDYYSSDSAEQYVDAVAPKGKQFCTVTSLWTNTSKEPASIFAETFSALSTADETVYGKVGDDSALSSRLTEQGEFTGGSLNPGDSVQVHDVFTVPAEAEFTRARAGESGFGEPDLWFALQ